MARNGGGRTARPAPTGIAALDAAIWSVCDVLRWSKCAGAVQGPKTESVWYHDLSDIKVGKKKPLTLDRFERFFELLPTRGESERSWSVSHKDIEAKKYDLKAVNPNRKAEIDPRTPAEILASIEIRHAEVASALRELRKLIV